MYKFLEEADVDRDVDKLIEENIFVRKMCSV